MRDERACEGVVCKPCLPAITVFVTAGSDHPLPEPVLSGVEGECTSDGGSGVCTTYTNEPGDYAFEVRAAGYKPAAVRVTVPEVVVDGACCGCGYEEQEVRVVLERE
ncbi:hypothetical protein HPC49_47385 [Pyxidicoccus fallax]|uniref:Uncharacterized protein n=1 Tax=Pyxidicoccus fallax TaxID=394095 RepID=A0A848LYR4_9BACT|nr:hypothetical protein [Pyxidicoccus fallax]NMO22740.1 hypothetical protein [Pyxidicoccus fallax]NPC85801.1 hypothetical protein [Pyxidicoccus fallax]